MQGFQMKECAGQYVDEGNEVALCQDLGDVSQLMDFWESRLASSNSCFSVTQIAQ